MEEAPNYEPELLSEKSVLLWREFHLVSDVLQYHPFWDIS